MPPKRTRNTGNAQNQERLNKELRNRKLALFIQQFEEEAQRRLNELDSRLENMLATIDKVFEIELLKMPPSLQNTLMGDLIREEELSAGKVVSSDFRRGKGSKRPKPLVGSSSTGTLGTQGSVTKPSDEVLTAKRKLRSVSMGDLHCSVAGSAAHITVTTALGQAVCFSEENKDKINLDLLDDVAWCQVEKLSRLMEYVSERSRCHSVPHCSSL
ncbi:borealin-2 isoform X3 [Dunckerocampus dactyliophorus]|uniref:borealin-2 isoform X3 n=1 Tax=Dunckerocampus dactyliophorus TaxID=161453 RepID=UPI002406D76F|nr:borealin-2 isoform X3 [Dunckerocampus dactyliophorus]